jgi:rhodanese-related sulfurtransferase
MFESSRRAEDVNISAEEAQARQQAGAVMLDVREPDEWQEGHIPGARHVPLGELQMRLGELDRTQEVVAVCHSGYRSGIAVRALQATGFARVWNLKGGMLAWERARLPVTPG